MKNIKSVHIQTSLQVNINEAIKSQISGILSLFLPLVWSQINCPISEIRSVIISHLLSCKIKCLQKNPLAQTEHSQTHSTGLN